MLKNNTEFVWSLKCKKAFEAVKKEMVSDRVLVHFDPNKPLRLACDSSEYGIGAVLSHVMPDRSERPIMFISRILSDTERNYAMVCKEALSIFWTVSRLYEYLAGRKFEITTDHKSLQSLFGERKGLPKMASGRLQRWSLFLSGFYYSIRYIKGSENRADALSRLPLPIKGNQEENLDY